MNAHSAFIVGFPVPVDPCTTNAECTFVMVTKRFRPITEGLDSFGLDKEPLMTIQERIQLDITEAMKAKDSTRLDVLRAMKTAIKMKEVEKMKALAESEVLQVLQTLVKQRKDSIE